MSLDSKGRVYVKDENTRGVIALGSELTYLRTLGRAGEGPGEFRHVSTVQVLPGDSVFVYDRNLNRNTVFGPGSGEAANVQRLPGISYQDVYRIPDGFLAVYSAPYQASGEDIGVNGAWLLRLRQDGSVVDSLFSFPPKVNLVYRRGDPRGGGIVSTSSHPFSHKPFVRIVGGNHPAVVYASSLALDVTTIDIETGVETAFSFPTTPMNVTPEELTSEVEKKSTRFASMLRDGTPYTWPPLIGMIADDNGTIFLGIRTTDRAIWEWAMFRSDGTHLGSVALPAGFVAYAYRDGRLIGSIANEFDVPEIRAYRVDADMLEAPRRPPD